MQELLVIVYWALACGPALLGIAALIIEAYGRSTTTNTGA
jgi:hypothetical protein